MKDTKDLDRIGELLLGINKTEEDTSLPFVAGDQESLDPNHVIEAKKQLRGMLSKPGMLNEVIEKIRDTVESECHPKSNPLQPKHVPKRGSTRTKGESGVYTAGKVLNRTNWKLACADADWSGGEGGTGGAGGAAAPPPLPPARYHAA